MTGRRPTRRAAAGVFLGALAGPMILAAPSAASETVLELQKALAVLGYTPGPPDGAMGPNTRAALAAFERDEGLPETGEPTPERMTRLREAVAESEAARATLPFDPPTPRAVLLDASSGAVLFQKNAHRRMYPASMTKVMTAYLVFDSLAAGALRLDDRLTVSRAAWRKGGSRMFVEVDTEVSVEDLLRGVIVQSGNDASIVLAEGLAGSEAAFAARMTEIAGALGMTGTRFRNATGWPDPDHYATTRDMVILCRAMIERHPALYPYFSEAEFTHNDIRQENRNPLLGRVAGADGIKTGHTDVSGYSLAGSAVRDGRRLIVVVSGARSDKARAEAATALLEWGFSTPSP
jgi:D-alanyl-D-alanine carboxypeptidase (penicillin-binding protein 5/6)